MKSFALSDANHDLSMLVDKAAEEPILITRQGEEAAVVISPSLYQEMTEALENHEDIAAYDSAKARKEDSVLWQDARKDLGLVWALLKLRFKRRHASFLERCRYRIGNELMMSSIYKLITQYRLKLRNYLAAMAIEFGWVTIG